MPKNWAEGGNSKAVEARLRKAEQRRSEEERKQKQKEDEYWRDDDPKVLKKTQRKEEKEKKHEEELNRKKEREALLQKELEEIASKKAPPKVTAYQMEQSRVGRPKDEEEVTAKNVVILSVPEENPNRMNTEGEVARDVDDAIRILQLKDGSVGGEPLDRHPERRLQAAYTAYEEKNLARVKAENPTLRLSQLKQILKRDWMKSPENPMNKPHATYDAKAN